MKQFALLTALGLAMTAPALAGPSWQELSDQTALRTIDAAPAATTGVTIHRFAVPVRPAASSPSFFANFVAAGIATAGVPCFGCVTGAPSALGIPDPFNYVPSNTTMQYNVAWTNLTFQGTCTVYITITAGKTKLDSAKYNVPGISGAGGFDIGLNRDRPTYSGPAVVTGKVKCGSASSSVKANLIFQ